MLGFISVLGSTGTLLVLVFVNSASWLGSILLSIWLAVEPARRRHPLVAIVPSLSVIVLIYNVYLLGQPNLLLLALLLGAFACIRMRRYCGAGALVATAAAIKAFPILVLGYLIYRRMWTASISTVAILTIWLFIAPLPFRSPAQVIDDFVVWSQGMVLTYNSYGIAQRPFRSYSYKNQSIMALAHRLLRDVPADGELVLSRRLRTNHGDAQESKRVPAIDPASDLLSFLKRHSQSIHASSPTNFDRLASTLSGTEAVAAPNYRGAADALDAGVTSADRTPRWDDVLPGAEAALRNAWRANFVNLSFGAITAITAILILALSIFVAAVLPPSNRRTPQTDALEFALITLLTLVFSPLSFNYAYVWLLYPTTVGLHLVIREPVTAPLRLLKLTWIVTILLIPATAIPMPQIAQAYGNLFVPALLLILGLGMELFALGRGATSGASA
jgi:hypothetical protein